MSDNPYIPVLGPRSGSGGLDQLNTDLQLINRAINNLVTALQGFVSGNTIALIGTTAQKNALTLPRNGLLFYDSTLALLQINTGTPLAPVWVNT
jgi:hypothetical protein